MLQLQNVKKIYHTKGGDVYALNGVSITFPETGLVFINGKSGCGKTTLLNVIGGLDDLDQGEILVQDKRLSTFSAQEYDNYRNTFIGFIFQEYNLLPEFTVEQNIKIAMELQGRAVDEEAFDKLLQEVEIQDLKNRKPAELSGGQRQRVAIARALVKQPHIIMADEPTGALDSATGVQVFDTLKKLSKNKLVIVVSHDQEFAEKYADRIIHLVDGNVFQDVTFLENEISTNLNETENSLVKEGAELTDSEKDTLAHAIKTRKKIEFTEKFSYREKQATGEVPFANHKRIPFQKSKMKLKSAAFLGVKSLSVKPFRLAITILISAIAFAVFGVFDTLANFNVAKILENTLKNTPVSTVTATTQYVLDHENGDLHNIKISDAVISELSQTTGGTVKGIYDLDDNTAGSISHTYPISELNVNAMPKGRKYYSNAVNGFIEFDTKNEINPDGKFKDFPYQLVAGYYPTINYTPTGELIPTSIFEIAISTHLADSILYYLGESTLNGQKIHTSLELIDKEITIRRQAFKIVGIIDCGNIPSKYDILKETSYYNVDTKSLSEDYEAYINASAQRCVFVGKGFLDAYNQIYQSENIYYSGTSHWGLYTQDSSRRKTCYNYFYNVNEFNKDNVLLFDEEKYDQDGSVQLAKDEIIIDCGNLKTLLATQISTLISSNDRSKIQSLIEEMRTGTNEINRYNLNAISNLLNIDFKTNACTNVTITKISSETGKTISNPIKIVGVYFNVDPLKYAYGTTFSFMVSKSFMEEYQIYTNQGDYSKLLFSPTALQSGAKEITNLMLSQNSLALTWYKNTVLNVIQDNEKTIEQVADLLLYVAIALIIFSVFMLFNYISTSISGKRKSVGVLRGLGASGKDVLITFLIESLIIAIINGILANVFATFGCSLVNSYVMNTMNIFVAFALFGTRQLVFILGVSICTALISSAFPIIKIAKKKPVALIR